MSDPAAAAEGDASPAAEALAKLREAMRTVGSGTTDPDRRRAAATLSELVRCDDDHLARFAARHLPGRKVDETALRAVRDLVQGIGRLLALHGKDPHASDVVGALRHTLFAKLDELEAAAQRPAPPPVVAAVPAPVPVHAPPAVAEGRPLTPPRAMPSYLQPSAASPWGPGASTPSAPAEVAPPPAAPPSAPELVTPPEVVAPPEIVAPPAFSAPPAVVTPPAFSAPPAVVTAPAFSAPPAVVAPAAFAAAPPMVPPTLVAAPPPRGAPAAAVPAAPAPTWDIADEGTAMADVEAPESAGAAALPFARTPSPVHQPKPGFFGFGQPPEHGGDAAPASSPSPPVMLPIHLAMIDLPSHAAMTALLQLYPDREEEICARYGLMEPRERKLLDDFWFERFRRIPSEREEWGRQREWALAHYRSAR